MKLMNSISTIVVSVCIAAGLQAVHTLGNKKQLDTTGGIEAGNTCTVQKALIGDGPGSTIIVCGRKGSGSKVYVHIREIKGSATGTPPHIAYKNYIGSYVKKGASDIPGAGRRIIFLDASKSQ